MTRREAIEKAAQRQTTARERRAGRVPQEWIRAVRSGRSAKWVAREIVGDETRYREIHLALLACNAYSYGSGR